MKCLFKPELNLEVDFFKVEFELNMQAKSAKP